MSLTSCPKCRHKIPLLEHQHPPESCPACGIVYHKYAAHLRGATARYNAFSTAQDGADDGLWAVFKQQIFAVPEVIDPVVYWGRMITLLGLFLWTGYFVRGGVDWEIIGGSFLHNINLPFHEFGHVLFSPFGEFMFIAGGSLFQVIMPLGLMVGFSWQRADNFGAAVMLWWSGQNFMDVAPYIADAQDRLLPLVGGGGEESHDWGNLLAMTNTLAHASQFAQSSFVLGSLLMIAALTWASYIGYLQKSHVTPLAG